MIKKKLFLTVVCIVGVTLFSLSSCSTRDSEKVTVLGYKDTVPYNEMALKKISSIQGSRGIGWADENTIVHIKENKQMPKLAFEDAYRHPDNLYQYNMLTKKDSLFVSYKQDIGQGVFSPDKKYIFCIGGVEGSPTGLMYNSITKEILNIGLFFGDKHWIDNNTILYNINDAGKQGIYQVDTSGKKKLIMKTPGKSILNVAKIEDVLFYTTFENELYMRKGNETKLINSNSRLLYPSPDSSKLAVVKPVQNDKMDLILMNSQGQEIKKIEQGIQIESVSWSPDSTKLAFSGAGQGGQKAGLFMADIKSGKVVQLVVGPQYVSRDISWSPSGRKLLTWYFAQDQNGSSFITYIIEVK